MTRCTGLVGGVAFLLAVTAGCGGSSTAPTHAPSKPSAAAKEDDSKKIAEALAKLSPEDRKLAEEQKYCPDSGQLLGSMDMPVKLSLKDGKTIFVCCSGCKDEVEKDPEAALKKIAELKAKEGK